jgi:hypothetical protein
MKDIYSTARETVAWLGPDEHGIAGSAFSHLNWVSANASGEQIFIDLNSLMHLPAWLVLNQDYR